VPGTFSCKIFYVLLDTIICNVAIGCVSYRDACKILQKKGCAIFTCKISKQSFQAHPFVHQGMSIPLRVKYVNANARSSSLLLYGCIRTPQLKNICYNMWGVPGPCGSKKVVRVRQAPSFVKFMLQCGVCEAPPGVNIRPGCARPLHM
jgi:hypothetical protein